MKTSIKLEWMKLFRQRKVKVMLLIAWLGALFVNLGNLYLNNRAGFTVISPDNMPMTTITLMGALLIPLLTFIVSVDFTAYEHASGTAKFSLMAPMSASRVYASKLAALVIYDAVMLAGIMLMSLAVNMLLFQGNAFVILGSVLLAYMITMIPVVLISLWGMFLGSRFSSGFAIGFGIFGVLAANVVGVFVPVVGSVSPIGYMNLYQQVLYGNSALMAMVSVLLYLVAYYIILVAVNIHRLQTAEI